MKNLKYIFATIALGVTLTSCGDSFLDQDPENGIILPEQFEKLSDNLEGSIMGIYSEMYAASGTIQFGQRAIDMYGDIQSGDMAMKKNSYGWFESYERGFFYAYAGSYIWSYYYDIIHLTNLCAIAADDDIPEIINAIGSGEEPSNIIAQRGYYYGQILTMRGWAYAGLLRYFCDPMEFAESFDAPSVPIYTATEVKAGTLGERRASIAEVYDRIYEDLATAIEVLDYYSAYNKRSSKLEVDADVARVILAYAMLNLGEYGGDATYGGKKPNKLAEDLAAEVINKGKYPLLPKTKLTTTGFADVNSENWMWGEDVEPTTTTMLASFFGQVDIHTYSYATAGDTKGIDSKLYDEIAAKGWDARVNWFRSGSEKFPYCPDGKFYCPSTKHTTDLTEVDGNWLCDNVFMRVEVAYLIAAEAAYKNNDQVAAVNYLKKLCDERVLDGKDAEYAAWLATLSGDALKNAIIYNWRVEMWGEGYALQTLRRLSKTVTLGDNHISRYNKTININDESVRHSFQCQIPTSESRYNPNLNKGYTTLQPNNTKTKWNYKTTSIK